MLYDMLTGRRLVAASTDERRSPRHALHGWALAAPFAAFLLLSLPPWNPIYPGVAALLFGAAAAALCRPDLGRKTAVGALLLLGYYAVFFLGLQLTAPAGYVERVWNLPALSGLTAAGVPVDELLFALAFGACWAGVYEHFMWRTGAQPSEEIGRDPKRHPMD